MLRYEDLPENLNLASYFVDGQLEAGRGGSPAIITPDRGYTYAELAALVSRFASGLSGLGVRREERVLIASGDGIEFVAAWFGTLKAGSVTAEAYTFLQVHDYRYYLDYTRAAAAVVDETTLEKFRQARIEAGYPRHLIVVGDGIELEGDHEVAFDDLIAAGSESFEPAATHKDEIVIWKFTTGSTGSPKAAVHPVHSPILNFESYGRGVLDLTEDDVVLPVPKLFFGYARDLSALYNLGVGGAGIVYPERPTPSLVFDLIARHSPTILVQVPTMMRAMLAEPGAQDRDLSCLRLCTSAGEALPTEIHRRWLETYGVEVLDGIGSAELYHIYISNRPGRARLGSTGEMVPGYTARVVGENNQTLAPGETGELWVEGETSALLYWNAHEKSKATFAGDLVRTGDLFDQDEDGFFYFRGRRDDMAKVAGIWVSPLEIENSLLGHPEVAECAVITVEREGLTLTRACVVLTHAADRNAEELAKELQDHVRLTLAPHKYPREVVFLPELPKTSSGKVHRRRLREAAASSAATPT